MSNKKTSEDQNRNLPYTLAFRLPAAFRDYFATCQRKLDAVCNSFEPPELGHLTVKFLGFSSEFLNDARIVELLPVIHEVTRKYLPLKIFVRGFDTFTYAQGRNKVIYLKVLPNPALNALHHEFCDKFSEFEMFPHADKENFQPHITLSKDILPDCHEQLNKILLRSKKMAKRHIKISDLVVMNAYRLFPVTDKLTPHLICPPAR